MNTFSRNNYMRLLSYKHNLMLPFRKKGKYIVQTLTMNNTFQKKWVTSFLSIVIVMISHKETSTPYVNNISLLRLLHKIYVTFLDIEKLNYSKFHWLNFEYHFSK